MSVRVRFAPSPTGSLHTGGARTALFNFLFAQKYQGQFIIRVEDTDLERNKEPYLKEQLETLLWLGLKWDEGPSLKDLKTPQGSKGPYRQSQRLDIYKKYATQLLKEGQAYYCFLTEEEIQNIKSKLVQNNQPYRLVSPYRDISLKEAENKIKEGKPAVIRFKIPDSKTDYKFEDGVRGKMSFPSDAVGDFVLVRSNGMPVYNFCCAVDDALMEISHVLRAEEHLPNTLRQLMIIDALDLQRPEYMHLSLILDKNKKKLSKREGALSCLEYKNQGYLPEALNNFLFLLGCHPKTEDEIFQFQELVKNFAPKHLNSSPAVFDEDKLLWIQSSHIRSLTAVHFWNQFESFLENNTSSIPKDASWREQAYEILKSSFSTFQEAKEIFDLFSSTHFEIKKDAQEIKDWPQTKKVLELWKKKVESIEGDFISVDQFTNIRNDIQKELDVKGRFLFMPLRVALIGQKEGLELKNLTLLLNKEILIKRAKMVIQKLYS